MDGLVKRYGSVVALDHVDLTIHRGEVVVLLGPNGAGKSTLLRILGTTVLPDAGHARIAGYDVATDPVQVRRHLGLSLGDERSWYWRLTGRQNLEFFAALYGMRRRSARRRTNELLAQVGLSEAADRRFNGYSTGMRARLSLARALLASPLVLLLDEPTRALDPVAAAEFREVVRHLATDEGRIVLFATHDLHEAAAVADRVVVMTDGKIVTVREHGIDAAGLEQIIKVAVRR